MRIQKKSRTELKIYNKIEDFKAINPVVTIGIFDGVHLGHIRIINRIKEIAGRKSGETVVVTLWPHPRQVLGDENTSVHLLSTLNEKIKLIEGSEIDHLIILPFTKDFANTTFTGFIEKYLVKGIKATHIVIGFNHHFGKDRKGGFEHLKESAVTYGYTVERLDPFTIDNRNVSSSAIRSLIAEGDVTNANQMLGYKYALDGKVVEGKKIGRLLGFPTANIKVTGENKLVPATGVYAVLVEVNNVLYKGMLNIGYRPTITDQMHNYTIEVHILDFNKNIYGEVLRIAFIERLRNEKKFNSADELIEQLIQDKTITTEVFKRLSL